MPDQVDWRALEREASPGRAVGRLLRDQREARGLGLSEVEKSLRIRRSSSRSDRGRSLRQAARRRLHPGLPARLCGACRSRSREGADGLSSFRSGSDQASSRLAGRLPDRREARADRPGGADRVAGRRRGLRRLALSAARAGGRRREGAAGAGSPAGVASGAAVADRRGACRDRARAGDDGRATAPPPPRKCAARPAPLPAEAWPARRDSVAPPTQPQPRPRRWRRRSSLPCRRRRRRRSSMTVPAIGQAQAAQPPAPVEQPRVTTQQPRAAPRRGSRGAQRRPPMRRPQTCR